MSANNHPLNQASLKALKHFEAGANANLPYALQLVQWALEERPGEIPVPAQVADLIYIVRENSYMMNDWHPSAVLSALDNDEGSLASMDLDPDELAISMAENLYWYLEKQLPVLRITETWD